MKTGNTLRTAKNSLLCFFMTLAGGFLVACGSSSDGGGVARLSAPSIEVNPGPPPSFSAYLLDTAVKGVSVSGPTGDGLTGDGGVFTASDGVFEFSIGGTDLGRVSLNSDWKDSQVTPADFIGVNEPQVITIARIMQALDLDLDENGMQVEYNDRQDRDLQNGISISQAAREDTRNLFTLILNDDESDAAININGEVYDIPSKDNAENHLLATRQCLFSGGYVGDYRANGDSDERGTVYYAVEPFADRVRRFGFTVDVAALQLFAGDEISSLVSVARGIIGGTELIVLTQDQDVVNGATAATDRLNFITPRSVEGAWNRVVNSTVAVSGTHDLTAVAGNPGATRRIVGVETTDNTGATVAGMYVLDHFAKDNEANGGSFSGQYYSVNDGAVLVSPLTLTIATDNGAWLASDAAGMTLTLMLSGTRGEDDMTIAMQIVRADENYGSFDGVFADGVDNELSGTWCDIGGAVGSTVAPTLPTLSNTDTVISITWAAVPGATVYNLYRSTVSVGSTSVGATVSVAISETTYMHDRPSADTEYFYQLEACNSAGCSERSPEVSTNPPAQGPAVAGDGNAIPECSVGTLAVGESCTWRGVTLMVGSGRVLSVSIPGADSIDLPPDGVLDLDLEIPTDSGNFLRGMPSGTAWEITEAG